MDASSAEAVHEIVGRTLAELGTCHVFGVVGSGNYEVTDAAVRAGAIFVGTRHEAAAAMAVDSYWRTTGAIAACSVHQGPGLTNTLTAIADAAKARSALLVVAGATSAGAFRSNFHIDQGRLVEAAGGIAERIHSATSAADDVRRALRRARVERRPVLLDMPLDIQHEAVPRDSAAAVEPLQELPRAVPSWQTMDALTDAVRRAEHPVIIAGRGAWSSGAREHIEQLADVIDAALATTALAKGMFSGNPRDVGIAGGFSDPPAVTALEGADLLLALGSSLTTWTTRGDTIFDHGPHVIQVDSDPLSLSLNRHVDLEVIGDVRETVSALLDRLGPSARLDSRASTSAGGAEAAPSAAPVENREPRTAEGRCHPGTLTRALDAILPEQRTLIVDGGHFIGWPVRGLSVPDPDAFVFSSAGFQSIGLGLGAAIGAAIARPDRLTVLAAGDGGLLMSLTELETLTRIDRPLAVLVYNDAAYGAEVHHFRELGSGLDLVQFPETDFAALAASLGLHGAVVRSEEDLATFARWCQAPEGSFVLDLRIDPDIVGPWAEQDFLGH